MFRGEHISLSRDQPAMCRMDSKRFWLPPPSATTCSLLALSSSLPISIRWDIIKRDPYAGCAKKDPGKDGRASSVRLKTGAGGGLTLFSLLSTSSVPWENGILHAMKMCAVLQSSCGNTLSAREKNGPNMKMNGIRKRQ